MHTITCAYTQYDQYETLMNTPKESLKDQHEMIKQGGQIEKFAEAMASFCKAEGWKKLNDKNGDTFKTLRHYIEAEPPFGAGYPGKSGMEKIEAYLSLSPVIKDYFQHCHANCLFEMAEEEGVSPGVVAKREWNDVKGASLARAIKENPEEIYLEKAAAFVEGKERVKPKPRKTAKASPIRLHSLPDQPYSLAKKIKENFKPEFIQSLINAFNMDSLDEMIEREVKFTLAMTAFNQSKQAEGWGIKKVQAPTELKNRTPLLEKSEFIGDEMEEKNVISLKDNDGKIVIVRFKGTGVSGLSFSS